MNRVVKNRARHFGKDSSAFRSELSSGHFSTSADLSGQFSLPKCPESQVFEVSVIHYLTYRSWDSEVFVV